MAEKFPHLGYEEMKRACDMKTKYDTRAEEGEFNKKAKEESSQI
jgi:hypothetical protein